MNYITRHDKTSYAAKYGTGRYILCYEKVTKTGAPRKGARRKIIKRYETVDAALNAISWASAFERVINIKTVKYSVYDSHWNVIWQEGQHNGN